MQTKTSSTTNSMNPPPWRRGFVLIAFILTGFALSPHAQAVCNQGCGANFNTFLGESVLDVNTTGTGNTGIGFNALYSNTSGYNNTATGAAALFYNTTGYYNTATGFGALVFNTTGSDNTANGQTALYNNTTGGSNTANGVNALYLNTTGTANTASGLNALFHNTEGYYNTAIGYSALFSNTTGDDNIAVGFEAGVNLTTGSNNIDIGNAGVAGEASTIRIGTTGSQTATYIAGIRGVPITGGQPVGVSASGQLGVRPSSARYKEAVKPMGAASEEILALQPVTFRYKHELDPKGMRQFGLVAEEVEKIDPNLITRDEEGKAYTVRYEEVNAMLLNEFLKARRQIDAQQKQIEALTAGLQRVSAQLELSKSAPQTVLNDQ